MTSPEPGTLAEKIKTLRAEKHIGVRELGRMVEVSGMHISNLEKGKSAPSPELVKKLAEALDTDLDQLLHLANLVDPEAVSVIQKSPLLVPAFLRSAKNLTSAQWDELQRQVEEMSKPNKA